jgi:acetaldehyde dehydrogenase (acetylating)
MPRNTEGLKRSARLRSESAHARAMAALQRMEAADQEINFRAVSSEARVSTALAIQPTGTARPNHAFAKIAELGPSREV